MYSVKGGLLYNPLQEPRSASLIVSLPNKMFSLPKIVEWDLNRLLTVLCLCEKCHFDAYAQLPWATETCTFWLEALVGSSNDLWLPHIGSFPLFQRLMLICLWVHRRAPRWAGWYDCGVRDVVELWFLSNFAPNHFNIFCWALTFSMLSKWDFMHLIATFCLVLTDSALSTSEKVPSPSFLISLYSKWEHKLSSPVPSCEKAQSTTITYCAFWMLI